jgi:hypothetical protein
VSLSLELENRQRAHCLVTPMLTPLVSEIGVTWFADATIAPPTLLLANNRTGEISLLLQIPDETPAGSYRGALILYGFRSDGLPVRVDVKRGGSPSRAKSGPRRSRHRGQR